MKEYVNKDIALIAEENCVYINDDNSTVLLKNYSNTDKKTEDTISIYQYLTRGALIGKTEFNQIGDQRNRTQNIKKRRWLDSDASPMLTYPNEKELNCTIVQQLGEPICWAAVVASLGLHETGISKTASYVSKQIFGDHRGGTAYDMVIALQQIYDIRGVDQYYAPYFSQLQNEIAYDHQPVYLGTDGTKGPQGEPLRHCIFTDGYSVISTGSYIGRLSIGDPNDTTHRSIYFQQDQVYPYSNGVKSGVVDEFILLQ